MKERGMLFNSEMVRAILEGRKTMTRRVVKPQPHDINGSAFMKSVKCPCGQIGDRIWVRETALYWRNIKGPCSVAAYKEDGYELEPGEKWTPSIHMPRWASRITLEITNVRVERLNDISEEDAKAEGIKWNYKYHQLGTWDYGRSSASRAFRDLWESINGPGSWDANPWVWVIEFKRIEP